MCKGKPRANKLLAAAAAFASTLGAVYFGGSFEALAQSCADFKSVTTLEGSVLIFTDTLATTTVRLSRDDSAMAKTSVEVSSLTGRISSLSTEIPKGKYLGHLASTNSILAPYVSDCDDSSDVSDFESINFFRYNVEDSKDVTVLYRTGSHRPSTLFTFTLNWSGGQEQPQLDVTCEERDADFDFYGYLNTLEQDYVSRGLELGGTSDVNNAVCEVVDAEGSDLKCEDRKVCDAPYLSSSNEDIIFSSQGGAEDGSVATLSNRLTTLATGLKQVRAKGASSKVRAAGKVIKPLTRLQSALTQSKKTREARRLIRRALFIARVASNPDAPVGLRNRYVGELSERLKAIRAELS